MLEPDVVRSPQIAQHVAGRQIADPALAIVIGPASGSRGAVFLIGKAFFVDCLQEEVLGVLVVIHVMLFVGDDEVFDALRDGVIGIGHFHLESPDGRMPRVSRAQHVAEIGVGEPHVRSVVQEQGRASRLHKLAHGLALGGLHPILRLGFAEGHRRIENEFRTAGGDPSRVGAFVAAIALRPDHPVAQNDEDLIAVKRIRIEQRGLVGEVDGDAQLFRDGAGEADPNVVGVVIAIADKGEGGGFLAGRPGGTGRDGGRRQCGECRPASGVR